MYVTFITLKNCEIGTVKAPFGPYLILISVLGSTIDSLFRNGGEQLEDPAS